jgi:hypothetical protein
MTFPRLNFAELIARIVQEIGVSQGYLLALDYRQNAESAGDK